MRFLKLIWMIWVTFICITFCSHTHPAQVYGNEITNVSEIAWWKPIPVKTKTPVLEYTVVAGDTLGNIATRHNTTWEKLWELNKDRISDPNLIYIGQRIRITGKIIPPIPPMTREEKINKLAKFMFKISHLNYKTKTVLEENIQRQKVGLLELEFGSLFSQRKNMDLLYTWTRELEIWYLSEAIVDASKDEETLYKLVGLAWQESHFVNRIGKHGEVSFFQFLPSTIKSRLQLDDIGLQAMLSELSNDPKKATQLALEMMTEWKWSGLAWNGGTEFTFHWNNKVYWFKSEWIRR